MKRFGPRTSSREHSNTIFVEPFTDVCRNTARTIKGAITAYQIGAILDHISCIANLQLDLAITIP